MFTMQPLGGHFQIRYLEGRTIEKKTTSGIILQEKQPEKNRVVQVISAGPGLYNPLSGGRFESGIEVGDLIYVNQHGPVRVEHITSFKDEPETFLIGEADIFAVYMKYQDAVSQGIIEPLEV